MKIAITAQNGDLDSDISPVFNAADFFIIIDSDNVNNYEAIRNPHIKQLSGSEIFGAQLIISQDVKALMTGHCTPNASRIFQAAGIKVIEHIEGSVRSKIPELKKQFSND